MKEKETKQETSLGMIDDKVRSWQQMIIEYKDKIEELKREISNRKANERKLWKEIGRLKNLVEIEAIDGNNEKKILKSQLQTLQK